MNTDKSRTSATGGLRAGLTAFCLLALPLLARAQGLPRFRVDTPDASYAKITLQALEENGPLHIVAGGARRSLPGFIELRQEECKLPPLLTRNFLLLTNGDRIPLDPEAAASLSDSRLQVWPAQSLSSFRAKGLNLFAPYAVLLFWSLPEGIDDADIFFARLAEEPRKRDVVFLKNGDRIEGTLTALSARGGCQIASATRKVDVPWSHLAGLAWNTGRQARWRAKKSFGRAVIDGGARLNLLDMHFDEKSRHWVGKTQFGAALELPEAALLAFDVRLGPAVELADLTPTRYEQKPFLGPAWPLARDRAAADQPLRLAGSVFEKGLGLHAPCRVTYTLDGKFRRFDALVGIDDVTSPRGRAKIALEIDGKRIDLNGGKELTAATPPLEVRANLEKARTLTLIVEMGTLADVQANVNWAKARLVKSD